MLRSVKVTLLSLAFKVLLHFHRDTSHFYQVCSCIRTPGSDPACLLTSSPCLVLLFPKISPNLSYLSASVSASPAHFASAVSTTGGCSVGSCQPLLDPPQYLIQCSQAGPWVVFLVTRLCSPQFSVVLGVQSSPSASLSPRSALNLCNYHMAFL